MCQLKPACMYSIVPDKVSDLDRILFFQMFSDLDWIQIFVEIFGSDRIMKFQDPHNTGSYLEDMTFYTL